MDFLERNAPGVTAAFNKYLEIVTEDAGEAMTPRLATMVRLAVALAIPCKPLAQRCLVKARAEVSSADISGAVLAAAALRAGGSMAYGRLVFKLLEPDEAGQADTSLRSQLQKDRSYMTSLRKASPLPFDALVGMLGEYYKPDMPLTVKEYELIAVAVATVTQCVYCLEGHSNKAREAGASDREIADAVHLAISGRFEATLAEWEALEESIA